jgi:hypothetical protein
MDQALYETLALGFGFAACMLMVAAPLIRFSMWRNHLIQERIHKPPIVKGSDEEISKVMDLVDIQRWRESTEQGLDFATYRLSDASFHKVVGDYPHLFVKFDYIPVYHSCEESFIFAKRVSEEHLLLGGTKETLVKLLADVPDTIHYFTSFPY